MLILSINSARFCDLNILIFLCILIYAASLRETYIFTVIMYTKEIVLFLFSAVTIVI